MGVVRGWTGKARGREGVVRGCSVLRERGVAHEQLLARRQVELALGREARVQVHLGLELGSGLGSGLRSG